MTTVQVLSERQIILEAAQVLMEHMTPSKATCFWASWQDGGGDYLAIREQLFKKETVDSLYGQIKKLKRDGRNR
ncbi:MAG: hypothetical protein DPW18_18205 [Chloroflexi bacterium]|nr:MAG: hypothetical protein EDM79_19165 [Chloroflexota bacterium]MCQ3938956.1 hypothetical protein [Chloroflexota bacterium]MDL1943958.1 hypothetical protein [Chloroflexi bacterium CFX2]